jgi:hypothetical protein
VSKTKYFYSANRELLCPLSPTNKACLRFSDEQLVTYSDREIDLAFDLEVLRLHRVMEDKRKHTRREVSLRRKKLREQQGVE